MTVRFRKWCDYQQSTKAKGGGPWRKVWKSMASDYHVKKLTPEQRWQLVCMFLVADNEGVIDKAEDEMADICNTEDFSYEPFGHFLEFEIISNNFKLFEMPQVGKKIPIEIREEKRREDKEKSRQDKSKSRDDSIFDTFWEMYPRNRRKAKPQCRKKFLYLISQGIPAGDIIGGLERATNSREWQKEGGQYIPGPLPFLNQHQWECEWDAGTSKSETHETKTEGSL